MYLALSLAKGVDDGYGGIMYMPTTAGYIVLGVVLVAALIVASYLIGKRSIKISTKQLVVSSVCIAIAFVTSNIKLFSMPMGGSVTLLSMFFIAIIGYWYGISAGVLTGVAYGLLQLIIDPYILTIPQMLVDYPLAFGALGLAGIGYHIKKKIKVGPIEISGLQIGYICGVLGRYAFAFISGWLFFGEYAADYNMGAVAYSLVYNGAYLATEGIITLVIIVLPPVAKALISSGKMIAE